MKVNLIAAMLSAAVAAGLSRADEATNETTRLQPVVVCASRTGATAERIPAQVLSFGAEEISASGAKDIPEFLNKRVGMDVRTLGANPMLVQTSMRGFGENGFGRVKVLLDGEELNNADQAVPNLARIALCNVDRIEVLKGPSPVLHGDGAVAGVLNIVTDARDYSQKTRVSGRAGSDNTFGATFSTSGGLEDEGVQYSGAYDYSRSNGFRQRSDYDIHSANAGVRKNFDNGSHASFRANYQNAFYEMPGSLPFAMWGRRRVSTSSDDWARTWSYGIGTDVKAALADDQWLLVDAGFSRRRNFVSWGGLWWSDYDYGYESFFLSPRYVNESDVMGLGNVFTAGFDFRYDLLATKIDAAAGKGKQRFSRGRHAAYLHDELFLAETLSVVAGARMECAANRWTGDYGMAGDASRRDWQGDYELGVVWRPLEGLKAYARGTRFHRSAFCDESSYTADGRPLDPESGVSVDAGVEWAFLDEFRLDADFYGMVMEDEIFLDPALPPIGFNCNSPAKTRRLGMDAGFSWLRDKVAEASLRYGIVHADFGGGRYHGNDVPLVPNHRVRAEAGFWIVDDLELKGGSSFVSSQYVSGDFDNAGDRLKKYVLFDVGVFYAPSWAKGWKASFVVDNLFDRFYSDFATAWGFYPARGRNFMFTLAYEF